MQSCQQQIIALDTKYIKHRVPNQPAFRKIYLKRRLQLLGKEREGEETSCSCCTESSLAKEEVRSSTNYLKLRAQLLHNQCKAHGASDLLSTKSFSYTTGEVRPIGGSPSKSVTFEKSLKCETLNLESKPPRSEAPDFHGFHHLSDLHRAPVTHLKFAHNQSHTLLASSLDGSLSLHRLDSSPPTVGLQLQGHTAGVNDFDISTSNELVVSCSADGTVCLWQMATGKLLRQVGSPTKKGLTAARFLPGNNNLVVTGGLAGHVQIINISTGIFPPAGTSTVGGSVLCLEASVQDSLVWIGTDRGTVLSFKVDCLAGRLAKGHRMVVVEGGGAQKVTCISSRPPSTSGQHGLLLVNVGSDSLLLFNITDQLGALSIQRKFPLVHSSLNLRSAFAPIMSFRTGDCVVSASEDGAVYFFDLSRCSSTSVNKLEAHSCPAVAVAFNFDESFLATSDSSGLVIVWKR